jgi:hypothetical protein
MATRKSRRDGKTDAPAFETLLYSVRGRIATITLNRAERLNAINDAMPGEIRAAVETPTTACTSSCLPAPAPRFAPDTT